MIPVNDRKKEAELLNIKFHREKKKGRMLVRDKEKILNTKYPLSSLMWPLIRKACSDDVTKVEC